jgi:hypothetical protein
VRQPTGLLNKSILFLQFWQAKYERFNFNSLNEIRDTSTALGLSLVFSPDVSHCQQVKKGEHMGSEKQGSFAQ